MDRASNYRAQNTREGRKNRIYVGNFTQRRLQDHKNPQAKIHSKIDVRPSAQTINSVLAKSKIPATLLLSKADNARHCKYSLNQTCWW